MVTRRTKSLLEAALRDTPVVFLQGARQVGKTTLAKSLVAGGASRRYLTLDDATVLSAASSDPAGFVDALDGPVTIDEVQRVPELALAVKRAVDADRTPGRFLLTGSAGVLVLPRLADSLAGRMEVLTLWPMTQDELSDRAPAGACFVDRLFASRWTVPAMKSEKPALLDRLVRGGYPEMLGRADGQRRRAWFESYLTTILQRDVRDLADVEGITQLPRMLALLATRSGRLLNQADAARTLRVPETTFKRYLALLQGVFLVSLVSAWFTNASKRFAKASKLLVSDSGLLCHLVGADVERLGADPTTCGGVLESFVGAELQRQLGWSQTRGALHHMNVHQGAEVDWVIESAGGEVAGVEVKLASSVNASDFAGLRTLRDLAGRRFRRGVVVYGGDEPVGFGDDLYAMPIAALWR